MYHVAATEQVGFVMQIEVERVDNGYRVSLLDGPATGHGTTVFTNKDEALAYAKDWAAKLATGDGSRPEIVRRL
jgi:hypothetical protein